MGLNNFTAHPDDDDDDQNNGGRGGFPPGMFGPGGVGGPSVSGGSNDTDELAKSMLVEYNKRFQNTDAILFRDQLIEQVLSVLISKNKPNALLVGAAGVGKTKIAEDIARRIALGDALIPPQLAKHTIYELPISSIVAGSGMVGQVEEKVKAIVDFASNPKNRVILFMDEIHQLTGGTAGAKDTLYSKIAQILKPALARGDLRVIGATTSQEARSLDDDPAFARRFTQLTVDEFTPEQTITVLETVRPGLVAHYKHQITVSDDVLVHVVKTADQRSRAGAHRPDSAITLLDRAMADRVLEQRRLINDAVTSGNTATASALQAIPNMPLTTARIDSVAQRLLTGHAVRQQLDAQVLRDTLTEQLQGQDDVLDTLVDQLARHELGLFPRSTPIAWMFAGASGVGKTEATKIISDQLTGQPPIILNMTEYTHESSMARIVGAPPGYVGYDSNAELPFDSLESNPHRVILLDEFEKCDVAVQRLFLSALDEGYIKNAQGRVLDFSKAVVIATTNAARDELNKTRLGFGAAPGGVSHKSLNKILATYFDAELLGRFTLTVGFNPLNEQIYQQILVAEYARQVARIADDHPRQAALLPSAIPPGELAEMVKGTFVPTQGARPARRAVRSWIEDAVLAATATSATTVGPVSTVSTADTGNLPGPDVVFDPLGEIPVQPLGTDGTDPGD